MISQIFITGKTFEIEKIGPNQENLTNKEFGMICDLFFCIERKSMLYLCSVTIFFE